MHFYGGFMLLYTSYILYTYYDATRLTFSLFKRFEHLNILHRFRLKIILCVCSERGWIKVKRKKCSGNITFAGAKIHSVYSIYTNRTLLE